MPSHTPFEQLRRQRQFGNLGMPPSIGAGGGASLFGVDPNSLNPQQQAFGADVGGPPGIPQPPVGVPNIAPSRDVTAFGAPPGVPQPPVGVPNIAPPAIGAPPSFAEPLPPAFGRPLTIPPSSNPMQSAPSAFMGQMGAPGGIQALMGRFQQALPFLQQFGGFGGGMGAPQQFQGFAPQLQRSPQAQQLLGQQPTRGFGLGLFG